ncbi:MAG TPA: PQQ-binding-like beta-propeller repeat protein, partial [Pirellulales bacterium]|nr:PQQ-binding-like beta-propeller repeat protein [Pirellulales bacterium]
QNVLWKQSKAAGISSPIILNGKVYTQVRYKPDTKQEQEEVICLDANTGDPLWENKWNVFLSDVPAERVGWSNLAGDPETGRIYSQGVNGYFSCIDGETGKTIWSRSLGEEFGMVSPYGGRTHSPALFEDLVIANGVMVGWGETAVPAHRILAMDKNTGEVRWFASTNPKPEDTVYSTPFFTVIEGQAIMVLGSADGAVWGFQPRTGKPLWFFRMSRRGLNSSPTVVGDKVYMTQGEENLDNVTAGELVCFRGTGTGNITKTNEVWHVLKDLASKSSPLVVNGRVYSADDSGNLYIADAGTGKLIGAKPVKLIGTIVRATPLFADGKIYLCSTTAWHVMQPTENGVKFLSKMRLPDQDEVSGSLTVSHGKIYLPTGAALYCLGKANVKPEATPIPPAPKEQPSAASETDKAAWVQVTPGELVLKPGQKQQFHVRLFNDRGQELPANNPAVSQKSKWELNGPGSFDANGVYTAPLGPAHSGAIVTAQVGEISGQARVRVIPPLPWKWDFNDIPLMPDSKNPTAPKSGEAPLTWIGARYRHKIIEKDDDKVMVKITTIPKGTRSQSWMGPDDMHDYTVQADLCGQYKPQAAGNVVATSVDANSSTSKSDATPSAAQINPAEAAENPVMGLPDMGLIAQRYTLDMMGNSQQLQIRSWPPQVARRFSKTIPFHWQGDKWYTMKFSASAKDGKAILKGKVWSRSDPEPDKWTIEAVDDVPNLQGSPGLFGQSTISEIYIDNVSVVSNESSQSGGIKNSKTKSGDLPTK